MIKWQTCRGAASPTNSAQRRTRRRGRGCGASCRFETRPYELPGYALDAVRLGDADAALVDTVSARLYLRDHPDWQADVNPVTDNFYAIATQARRPEISVVINRALKAIIDDGTLDALIKRWL